ASAVPRLIAVVVLPTPPFWLAIAITRGGAGLGMRLASVMTCGDSSAEAAGKSAWSVMALRPASGSSRFANRVESYVVLLRSTSRITIMRAAGSVRLGTSVAFMIQAFAVRD